MCRVWRMSLCPCLLLDWKSASWMRVKMKPLPPCLFLVPHIPLHLHLRCWSYHSPWTSKVGKSKVGKSVWDDPATALGRAHNIVIDDDLRGLSSILSHELVSRHICWYCILSTLDSHAGPWKIPKYYFLSIGLQEHTEWYGATHSGIRAPKVPLLTKMTKMPLVNPRFDRRSNKVKTFTKKHFS